MAGDPWLIVIDFVTAVGGVWLISAAVIGYSMRPLGLAGRAVYGIAGLLLMLPAGAFEQARWLNIAGAAAVLGILLFEKTRIRDAPRLSDAKKNVVRP
jgi:TRAP-type uncharacterized transport system fused permease subunit